MIRYLMLPLFFCASVGMGWAQETQPVTIDLANSASLAAQRNLTVKAAAQDVTTATKRLSQAEGLRRGRLNLNASYYHLNDPLTLDSETIIVDGSTIVIPGQTVADENVYFANINAAYSLYNAGRIRYGIKSANCDVSEARNAASSTQLDIVLQTTKTYMAAIYGRENVRVNEASLASYEQHLAQAEKSKQEGVATDYDVIRAQSAVEDQRKRLLDVQNQYQLALANLRTALALPKDAPIDLKGGFFGVPPEPPVGDAEESAAVANPLVKTFADRSCALEWESISINAERKPQLDAVAFANLFNRDNGFLTNPQWFLGVQLSWLIFDGDVVRSRAQEAESERVRADTDYQNAADQTRLAVRSSYLDMSTATGAIAASRKSVDLARESLRLAERRFAEGVGTSLEVLDANVNLLAAETGLQQSLYQLDSAYLTTHRYLGDIVQVAQTAQSAGGT